MGLHAHFRASLPLRSVPEIALPESGVVQDLESEDPVDTETPRRSVAIIWKEDFVCGNTGDRYTIVAAQSGATTSHEFDVLCDQIATFANPTGGHHKHRQQNQQQRRHRRAERKYMKWGHDK